MTALEYLRHYPSARPRSIAIRFKRDDIHEQLRKEVEGRRKVSWLGRLASWWRRA
ncbi:hypothetical protein [Mesorhizobium hungaricum]|jgi:hypothetical protein|uniref:hypothetical protein n=1 Tax=Mesorhizobium TaxID=68287 RepID=UPI00167E5E4F|nr:MULTISPECIES: hypothetical protein [Mesorhizobium]MBN9236047.1 hypothetical protein [Mesorhizobium sp.]